MSHFYKLLTINSVYDDYPPLAWRNYERASGKVGKNYDYDRGFTELSLSPPWPHCQMFKAPLITDEWGVCTHFFTYNGEVAMPDIWAEGGGLFLVNERAKNIIESVDDFEHQFIETTLLNEATQQKIHTVPYYQLNIRRYVQIEDLGGEVDDLHNKFRTDGYEDRYFPTVQQSPQLLDLLASLPIWMHRGNQGAAYLSETMLSALQSAGMTGLNRYSKCYNGRVFDGVPYESLSIYTSVE